MILCHVPTYIFLKKLKMQAFMQKIKMEDFDEGSKFLQLLFFSLSELSAYHRNIVVKMLIWWKSFDKELIR